MKIWVPEVVSAYQVGISSGFSRDFVSSSRWVIRLCYAVHSHYATKGGRLMLFIIDMHLLLLGLDNYGRTGCSFHKWQSHYGVSTTALSNRSAWRDWPQVWSVLASAVRVERQFHSFTRSTSGPRTLSNALAIGVGFFSLGLARSASFHWVWHSQLLSSGERSQKHFVVRRWWSITDATR